MNLIRYFATDRYAVYVWGSYGVTFVLLAGEVFMLWKRKRKIAGRDNPGLDDRESPFETSLQESQ
jgi:heme exporter protein CcmD